MADEAGNADRAPSGRVTDVDLASLDEGTLQALLSIAEVALLAITAHPEARVAIVLDEGAIVASFDPPRLSPSPADEPAVETG